MVKCLFDFDTVKRKPLIVSDYLNVIRDIFSVEDKTLQFIKRRTGRHMPVRKYAITVSGHFDMPFYKTIIKTIFTQIPNLHIDFSDSFKLHCKIENIHSDLIELNYTPRLYQKESAIKSLQEGTGIIVLPTSAGKTLTIALIVGTFLRVNSKHRALILVPNIQLVEQTYNDFLEYGINNTISKWTGDHDYKSTDIVIANNQILLSKKQDINVLNKFDMLVCDEVHKIGTAEKISKLIKSINCKHKFGFTGSMPKNNFDVWSINRIFGPVLYEVQSADLREEKYISSVRVIALKIEYKSPPTFTKPSMSNPTAGYIEEIEWIQTNEYRNSVMSKIVNKLETNTLVLVDRINHGEVLLDFFTKHTNKQVYFIKGSVAVEERENVKQIMEQTANVVCIAITNIFSTGISIKNLHNIIFASIGKARIKIIQSIGRSLRLHHTKTVATIFDIVDSNLDYGPKHFEERKSIYEQETIPINISNLVEK